MSVLRSKRKVAFSEFERQMAIICRHTNDRLTSVPSRYRKYLYPKIYNPMNAAYTNLILANEQNSRTQRGAEKRAVYFDYAMKNLLSMQKPMIALWNVLDVKEESCKQWADMFNREIALITGVTRKQEVKEMFVALPKTKIQKLAFLSKMAELHKYTYQKIGHAPEFCKDLLSCKIAEFIDTALYCVVMANHKIPETKTDAKKRSDYIQGAIDNLNGMQRPLLALWNIMDYSENVMDEWAGLLSEELKILEGLKKADNNRYKNLQ